MRFWQISALLAVLAALPATGCMIPQEPAAPASGTVQAQPKSPPLDLHRLEAALHAEINATRQRHRRKPLAHNAKLADVARRHSADMAAHDYFDHRDRRGERPHHRAARAGVRRRPPD